MRRHSWRVDDVAVNYFYFQIDEWQKIKKKTENEKGREK